jgi:LysR family glycine cleavage system transcriptional activator
MRRLPPVGAIQAFVYVARLGSVKAAAESLALSSPALTRRIQALEDFIGVRLFDRDRNRMRLNPEGASFLTDIEPHVDALAGAIDRVTGPSKGMRLRLTVPSLFASQRLMPMLPSLRDRHPNLHVDVDTADNRLTRLSSDELDAAIVVATSVEPKYYKRPLEEGRVISIGSRTVQNGEQALRDPADVARVAALLHRDMPDNFDCWRNAAGVPAIEPLDVSYFDSGQLILDAAAQGLGIAFMLASHLGCSTDDRLVQVFEQTPRSPYSYWFVCEEAALSRRAVRAFHDWLFETFAAAAA